FAGKGLSKSRRPPRLDSELMDGAVAQRLGQRVVDEPMLLEQRQADEAPALDGHLEMVAAAGAILDAQLGRVGKRVAEQRFEPVDGHARSVATAGGPGNREGRSA